MDSLMNATTHSTTNRTEPTRPDRELPAREHYPARASTIRHRLERAQGLSGFDSPGLITRRSVVRSNSQLRNVEPLGTDARTDPQSATRER